MLNKQKCPICKDHAKRDHVAEEKLKLQDSTTPQEVFLCGSCHHRWMTPPIKQETMDSLYDHDYFEDSSRDFSYAAQTNEHNSYFHSTSLKFKERIGTGELLDIGCATGDFMESAKSQGLTVSGIDPSSYAVDIAIKKGLKAKVAGIDILVNEKNKYDGIHMSHVLEHLERPHEALENITHALRDGGTLYLEVPNQFNSILDYKPLSQPKEKFDVFSVHHRNFFSAHSLTILLKESGLKIDEIKTYRSEKRNSSFKRRVILNSILFAADLFNRGDLISIWATKE